MKFFGVFSISIATVLLGAGVFFYISNTNNSSISCQNGGVVGGDIGGPFTLVDEAGKTVTDTDILKKPALIYFGYTFCPDICPLDAARNAQAIDILEELGNDVTPVFISLDPKRDTPERLAEFTDYIHPQMIGLTGSKEQIDQVAKAYKVYFQRHEDDSEYYLVDHSGFTYLMLPGFGFADFFNRSDTPDQVANRAACLINNFNNKDESNRNFLF